MLNYGSRYMQPWPNVQDPLGMGMEMLFTKGPDSGCMGAPAAKAGNRPGACDQSGRRSYLGCLYGVLRSCSYENES